MRTPEARHEYLHEPGDRRLWNESYYFDFNADGIAGFLRIGLQPFEDRANCWFYVLEGDDIYWFRDENIPIEDHYGLSVESQGFTLNFDIVTPHEEWELSAKGIAHHSKTSEEVFEKEYTETKMEMNLTFEDPIHQPSSMKLHVENQDHYNHAGQFTGDVVLDESTTNVDATGFRDHSWGWYRDWTPGEWGHYWTALQFEVGDCIMIATQIRPNGALRKAFGYHSSDGAITPIESVGLSVEDDLSREERPLAWARGEIPNQFVLTLEMEAEDETAEIELSPTGSIPLGYEDRNWELTDPDGPWLQSIINRMPLTADWDGGMGRGWLESSHPI